MERFHILTVLHPSKTSVLVRLVNIMEDYIVIKDLEYNIGNTTTTGLSLTGIIPSTYLGKANGKITQF